MKEFRKAIQNDRKRLKMDEVTGTNKLFRMMNKIHPLGKHFYMSKISVQIILSSERALNEDIYWDHYNSSKRSGEGKTLAVEYEKLGLYIVIHLKADIDIEHMKLKNAPDIEYIEKYVKLFSEKELIKLIRDMRAWLYNI